MAKILVIDDDTSLRTALEVAIKLFGHEVICASDGAQGIRAAQEHVPDLILCDVNMPGMDGRAVLQALRNDPSLANGQIVLMTGNQAQVTPRDGMNLGADDYLAKPFEMTQLKTVVEARLQRGRIHRRLEDGMLRRHGDLFNATLPHEFMTPLNGILGFAEILKEDYGRVSAGDARQMLGDIESCARRLHRTLLNYLQLVRIENISGQERITPLARLTGARMADLVTETAVKFARNSQREADLTVAADPAPAAVHEADLQTVIGHLVENACHYSNAGTPIRVSWKSEAGRPTLRVQDHGRGMSPEQIAQIGAFIQFDRKHFEQQGLGIGLAVAKRLLERQGGVLRFDSQEGVGTTAIVELRPADEPPAEAV